MSYLRTLIAIADEGSHEGAAKQMSRTQSAVSQRIRRLEEIFGVDLLSSVGRHRELTLAGHTLVRFGREIEALVDSAKLEVQRASGSDLLRIGAPQEIAENFLPERLATFAATMPNVRFEVSVLQSLNILSMLREGKLDVAISARPLPNKEGRVVLHAPCQWIASADFQMDPGAPLPVILTAEPSMFRRIALATLEVTGRRYIERVTAHNLYGVRLAVSAGLGVTARIADSFVGPFKILDNLPELPHVTYHAYLREDQPGLAAEALFDILSGHGSFAETGSNR